MGLIGEGEAESLDVKQLKNMFVSVNNCPYKLCILQFLATGRIALICGFFMCPKPLLYFKKE